MPDILIPEQEIQNKVAELSKKILSDYRHCLDIHCVMVLEGARTFAQAVQKEIEKEAKMMLSSIKVGSYGNEKTSSGNIKIDQDIDENIMGKDVVILEDIVDTGNTMFFLKNYLLNEKEAKSIKIASLLTKPARREKEIIIDYCGFEVPDKFVVGYGIDYAGKYRELPYIGTL